MDLRWTRLRPGRALTRRSRGALDPLPAVRGQGFRRLAALLGVAVILLPSLTLAVGSSPDRSTGGTAARIPRGAVASDRISLSSRPAANATPPNPGWNPVRTAVTPGNRSGAAMAYDPALGGVLLFGGSDQNCPRSGAYAITYGCNDTWLFRAGQWSELNFSHAPHPRADALMAYDPAIRGVILVGGNSASVPATSYYTDTWLFENGTWTNLTGAGELPVEGAYAGVAGLTYDAAEGYLVLVTNQPTGEGALGAYAWKFAGGAWNQVGDGLPYVDFYPGVVTYDADLGKVVVGPVFFSQPGSYISNSSFFALDGSTGGWAQLEVLGAVPPYQTEGEYDPAVGGVVGLGGYPTTPAGWGNATWELRGGQLSYLDLGRAPETRADFALTYDPVDGSLLLFGGANVIAGIGALNDTWEYLPAPVTAAFATVMVTFAPDGCPPILWDLAPLASVGPVQAPVGPHAVAATAICSGRLFVGWSATGGVDFEGNPALAEVEILLAGNGTLVAHYVVPVALKLVIQPAGCGSASTLAGDWLSSGSVAELPPNSTIMAVARACDLTGYAFTGWSLSRNLSANGSSLSATSVELYVTGPATLTLTFSSGSSPQFELLSGPLPIVWAGATGGLVGGLSVWLLRGRGRRGSELGRRDPRGPPR